MERVAWQIQEEKFWENLGEFLPCLDGAASVGWTKPGDWKTDACESVTVYLKVAWEQDLEALLELGLAGAWEPAH